MKDRIVAYCEANPGLELQDVFKYLYQSCMGCGHMVTDYDHALQWILEEAEVAQADRLPLVEPLDGAFCRVHLKMMNFGLSAEALCGMFVRSSGTEDGGFARLEARLSDLLLLARRGEVPFDAGEVASAIAKWREAGYPACHHSAAFTELYHPAYRVVRTDELAHDLLPKRNPDTHKYNYGRALIIAGSTGFSGAPALAANACERSGAGLTTVMVPESIYPIVAARCDGAVVSPVKATAEGSFSADGIAEILAVLTKADACVIGPGIRTGEHSARIVAEVVKNASCPLILDADALTICGQHPEILESCDSKLILTPHEGEFARIGGDLAGGRLAGAVDFVGKHRNTILVLKGSGTIIAADDGLFVNPTGNPGMAKGGSGDVLCGVMCALLAQGFDPLFSASCAAYLHGRAGDLACKAKGEYSMTPGNIIEMLPAAFQTVTKM